MWALFIRKFIRVRLVELIIEDIQMLEIFVVFHATLGQLLPGGAGVWAPTLRFPAKCNNHLTIPIRKTSSNASSPKSICLKATLSNTCSLNDKFVKYQSAFICLTSGPF